MPKDLIVIDDDSSDPISTTCPRRNHSYPSQGSGSFSTSSFSDSLSTSNQATPAQQRLARPMKPGEKSQVATQEVRRKKQQQLLSEAHTLQPEQETVTNTIYATGSTGITCPSAHGIETLMLPTIPLTSVLENGSASDLTPSKVILQTIPCCQEIQVGGDSLPHMLSSVNRTPEMQQHQVLVGHLPSADSDLTALINKDSHQSINSLINMMELSSNGQPIIAQHPGTVIATVFRTMEPNVMSFKEEMLNSQYPQHLLSNISNGVGRIVNKYNSTEETMQQNLNYQPLQTFVLSKSLETKMMQAKADVCLNNPGGTSPSSPNIGLTPVAELELNTDSIVMQSEHGLSQHETILGVSETFS
ncbi:ETS-related transcription factor Elf-4-like [Rhinatrema bivittatum]|nr:ETS-related transcription factor Elf-4-like [Rhinatrema bivittatum]